MTLDELAQLRITSVSGYAQEFWDAPAAVTVLTPEDFKRRGNTSIPEALRFIPGLQVGQIGSGSWGIGSRGFADRSTMNLLVLIDGRSVYTNMVNGVYWERHELILEDIERIEVIRGPGATLWGSNAVNGVINITTKRARDCQGSLVSGGFSGFRQHLGLRQGGGIGDDQWYRVYLQGVDHADARSHAGDGEGDGYGSLLSGFKHEWEADAETLLTLQGDLYQAQGRRENTVIVNPDFQTRIRTGNPGFPFLQTGGVGSLDLDGDGVVDNPALLRQGNRVDTLAANLMATLRRDFDADSGWQLKSYWDHDRIESPAFAAERHSFDLDARQWMEIDDDNHFIWGLGSRLHHDSVSDSPSRVTTAVPEGRDCRLHSAFLQNTSELAEDRLWLLYGSKFEWESYTGFNVQPSVRLNGKVDDRNSLWLAYSHAVQTPGRLIEDMRQKTAVERDGLGILGTVLGSGEDSSGDTARTLDAYEVGWRTRPVDELTLDLAVFRHDYRHLLVVETVQSNPGMPFVSQLKAEESNVSHGLESMLKWHASEELDLGFGYTYTHIGTASQDDVPRHMFNAEAHWSFAEDWSFHTVNYLSSHQELNSYEMSMGTGTQLRSDFGLSWEARDNLAISFWIQNAWQGQHPELADRNLYGITEIPRTFLLQLSWSF
jgi:iron complex outermembrane receptor protein